MAIQQYMDDRDQKLLIVEKCYQHSLMVNTVCVLCNRLEMKERRGEGINQEDFCLSSDEVITKKLFE